MSSGIGQNENVFFVTFKALCAERGLSVSAAAEEFGFSRSAVTSWKRGRLPNSKTLEKLADKLGVTPQYLVYGPPQADTAKTIGATAPLTFPLVEPSEPGTSLPTGDDVETVSEGEARSEDRSFLELAFALLKFYYPEETTESLAKKLGMSPKFMNAFFEGHGKTVYVDEDWNDKFYSLLASQNIPRLSHALRKTMNILRSGWNKSLKNKMRNVISDYAVHEQVYGIEYVFEDIQVVGPNRDYEFYATVKLGEDEKYWVFCFRDFSPMVRELNQAFLLRSFKLACDTPNVEGLCLTFTYARKLGMEGTIERIEDIVTRFYSPEIEKLPTGIRLSLIQLHSETRDIMEIKQINLDEQV